MRLKFCFSLKVGLSETGEGPFKLFILVSLWMLYFRTVHGLWAHLEIIFCSLFINQMKTGQPKEGYYMLENQLFIGELVVKLELVLKSPEVVHFSIYYTIPHCLLSYFTPDILLLPETQKGKWLSWQYNNVKLSVTGLLPYLKLFPLW